jgi:hypothetical protein
MLRGACSAYAADTDSVLISSVVFDVLLELFEALEIARGAAVHSTANKETNRAQSDEASVNTSSSEAILSGGGAFGFSDGDDMRTAVEHSADHAEKGDSE